MQRRQNLKMSDPSRSDRSTFNYLSGTVMLPSRIFAFASSTAFLASSERLVVVKSTPPSFKPKVVVLPPGNLPLAVWLAMSWTVLPTCFKLDAKKKLDSLPSLDLYLPSSVWSRSTPSTQTFSFSFLVSLIDLASLNTPAPVPPATW